MSKDKNRVNSNWVDSMVGYFSPMAGLQRMQARRAIDLMRKYEAASAGRRMTGWNTTSGGSANSEVGPALTRVRERVRDLVRNNPNATRAVGLLESYIVGNGIVASLSAPRDKDKDKIRGLWNDWADSTDCSADGMHNFYGLQALAARTVAESGECLVIRRIRRKSDGYRIPVPLQLEVVEGDFIDTTKEGEISGGGFILQGVEFNSRNQRVAYWLFDRHPGERGLSFKNAGVSKRVPAEDILHLYRIDRAGQVRGISWGAPCVVRIRDFDEYEDAQLMRQKIAACFSAFVRDIDNTGGDDITEKSDELPEKLESGNIEILPNGKTIEFPNIPVVQDDGHTKRQLRSIAMGWGVTYEGLSGDLSGVNYSSGRIGQLDLKRNVGKWQNNMFIPRFCGTTFGWFKEAADLVGAPVDGVRALWTPPKFEMIDPTKEIPAAISAIRGGIQSLPEVVREQGVDFEDHLKEIQKANTMLDQMGIILDSDPRKVMKAGILQTPTAEELSPDQGGSGGSASG